MAQPVMEMLQVAVGAAHAPDTVVVDNVDWSVCLGEFWVVGGMPGSGKSDLLATAAGLLGPRRGVHSLFGRTLTHLTEEEGIQTRRRVGLVFGNDGRLFQHLTVADNLGLPICYHSNGTMAEAAEQVESVLDHTGLQSLAHLTPGHINRTMRARVALARALVLQPELLLIDDPLRGLDPRQIRWWLDFLNALSRGHPLTHGAKLTMVVTAEDLRPWREAGKKFALVCDRQWLCVGDSEGLDAHPLAALREMLSD